MSDPKLKLEKIKQGICPHDEFLPFEEGMSECTNCGILVPSVIKRPCRYCDGTVLIFIEDCVATCNDCGEDYCPSEFGF